MFELDSTQEPKSSTHSLYFKRDGRRYGYAHFTLVHELGIVHAQTDWGDYCYRWGCIGSDTLEEFLIGLDRYYIGSKFCGKPKELDEDAIKKEIKKDIVKLRREGTLDSDIARECYNACADMDLDCSVDAYFCTFPSSILDHIYDGDYMAYPNHKKYTGWQEIFINEIFPTFQHYLKTQVLPQRTQVKDV